MALTTKTKIAVGVVLAVCGAIVIVCIVLTFTKKDTDGLYTALECAASQTNENACKNAGCKWDTSSPGFKCRLPENVFGFQLVNHTTDKGTTEAHLKVKKGSFFEKDFQSVRMTVTKINNNVLRVKFEDATKKRYEVPVDFKLKYPETEKTSYGFEHTMDENSLFSFKVKRQETGTVLFDSSVGSLFLADRHIEITTKLPTKNVYGIGENTHTSFKHNLNYLKWPLFSRDQWPDNTLSSGILNLYGVHPFYTCLEADGRSHGVLFLNSNPMDVLFTPMPSLTLRAAGGILDMFFFLGDNPEHVVQIYTEVIGRPMIPPYWSLGFQLSRYGYHYLDNMTRAISNTRAAQIPLDVVHADIDHMQENKDFTWDKERFPDFPKFIEDEKKKGLRVIIILDPALLANDTTYTPYTSGEKDDVFIKWPNSIGKDKRNNPPGVNEDKNFMFGRVWPLGPVAFPDFLKPTTESWWIKNIADYRREVNFDAIWIDMNEPAAFGTDTGTAFNCEDKSNCWTLACPDNEYDNLKNTFYPAAISAHDEAKTLSDKTICMAAVQGENEKYVHYDVHSLYGWSQIKPTYEALKRSARPDQVPLVISRATYPSSGRHAGHWLGDNRSRWEDIRFSIIGMLEFNLFGIPYIGADICGFFDHSNSELCGRWMQLGAFYPFSRNHNANGPREQDPGNRDFMTDNDIKRSKMAMDTRYQLLPYLHTLHYLANKNGNTVVRPLFHEYPTDVNTFDNQEQFLWGPALLISPALHQNQDNIQVYLPKDLWFDFYQGSVIESSGQRLTVKDTEVVPLHVRGGHILPMKIKGAQNTKESRNLGFELHVFPKDSKAKGTLFWMAESANDADNTDYHSFYKFDFEKNQLTITAEVSGSKRDDRQTVEKVIIYNQLQKPKEVKIENRPATVNYEDQRKILTITAGVDLRNTATPVKIVMEF